MVPDLVRLRNILVVLFLFLAAHTTFAQLSDLHYLPPLKQRGALSGHTLYISTPEAIAFDVEIYRGANATPLATLTISNTAPAEYVLPSGNNNLVMVTDANTGTVLNNSGLRLVAPNEQEFYVNYRGFSGNRAASLTSKGRVAMGTDFKWGGVYQRQSDEERPTSLGIMATEDNTVINIFDYDPDMTFRSGTDAFGLTDDTMTITLNANESFVLETVTSDTYPANSNGFLGASIEADKNIVVSSAHAILSRVAGGFTAGLDQIVPINRVGKEYVFIRGLGNSNNELAETVMIIATADNTEIYVNGDATPVATINEGDYYELIGNTYYSSTSAGANMFVRTSKDAYAYQIISGGGINTLGLNFVAPLSCLLPGEVDNIPKVDEVGPGQPLVGGVTIIAAVNTPDANIAVTDGNGPVSGVTFNTVAGTNDWKTAYLPGLTGNVSVTSTGPIAVGFFGGSGGNTLAGYYSGFDVVPDINVALGGGGCLPLGDIELLEGAFDAYEWFHDGVLIPGENGTSITPTEAGDYFLRVTRGPCTYDSEPVSAYYCAPNLVIDVSVDEPEILEGETTTFIVRAANNSLDPLTNIVVNTTIPSGLTFLTHAITSGMGSYNGSTWNIGSLAAGQTAELQITVRADLLDQEARVTRTLDVTATHDRINEDLNQTVDVPLASVAIYNDFDEDGVTDVDDQDDDNDGVRDTDECSITTTNLALAGVATASDGVIDGTFDARFPPRLVNDGGTSGFNAGNTIFRIGSWRNNNLHEWIDVDLGSVQRADRVIVFNRQFSSQAFLLSNCFVMVSDTPFPQNRDLGAAIANATHIYQFGTTDATHQWPIPFSTEFRYLRIQKSGDNIAGNGFAIAEIQILQDSECADPDGDGIPSDFDLDRDGDGCTDADAYYGQESADGDDGGEYGVGTPTVDPVTGLVVGATYRDILFDNPVVEHSLTVESADGTTDLTGQALDLGQDFSYVHELNNIGYRSARDFTMEQVLPPNVEFVGTNFKDSFTRSGSTFTYDATTHTLFFTMHMNDLSNRGRARRTFRVFVRTSDACSDFQDACSNVLQTVAYKSYVNNANPSFVYADVRLEDPESCIFPYGPSTTNTIDYNNSICNLTSTVELCGSQVVLSGSTGYSTYNWFFDGNGNGTIDISDTPLNDGDPDGDPSTLLVTVLGNYLVEQLGTNGCPSRVERIEVVGFGTSDNPVTTFLEQVNTDADDDNDIQYYTVGCSIDGELLPRILLCGSNDTANIQLGISNADSIVWELLDEASCAPVGDDCANKNASCSWNNIGNGTGFEVTDAGQYRIVVNYQNGCSSRFFFNVFKNNFDLNHINKDMVCGNPGYIRVTNLPNNYGTQLVNATDNTIVIPFSANHGEEFIISTPGVYTVQVVQLDAMTGDPLANSCIFETDDIAVRELNFNVDLGMVEANCNALGEVTVNANETLPNAHFELYTDNGSGGLGTLVDSELASPDLSYTFTSVNPGDYVVVTRTDDGCMDTQQITVTEVPQLLLSATVLSQITCAVGAVELAPTGGFVETAYQYAIWSKDGVNNYTDVSAIPATDLQTATTFTFGYDNALNYIPDEEGDYVFVVIDDNGCAAFSNPVTITDEGPLTIDTAATSHTPLTCADSGTSTLTVEVTGGTAPYTYSLDNITFVTTNVFTGLSAGSYTIYVRDSDGFGSFSCEDTASYEVDQPDALSASAVIAETACMGTEALVRIVNPTGGDGTYEYSFDGGATFGSATEMNLPAGDYQLVVRDGAGCTHTSELTVPSTPATPTFTTQVTYNCDGTGEVAVVPSNFSDYDFTYTLNGGTPQTSNVFTNVPADPDPQTITVDYSVAVAPEQSTLFFDDFGAGATTRSPYVPQSPDVVGGYCYEPQSGVETDCNRGPAGILTNGEYAVTNLITNPNAAWRNPNDHTGLTDGRFLAIDISTGASSTVLYERTGLQVLANQDIAVSLFVYNLNHTDIGASKPQLLIELVDNGGTVIASMPSADIDPSASADAWQEVTATFNPGANTQVGIVIRTNVNSDDFNDLALDDITATQAPETCADTATLFVIVEENQAFEVTLLNAIDPECNGDMGGLRFEVANFDTTNGFEYSLDGGSTWTTATMSPVTVNDALAEGTHTIQVRRANDTSCTSDFDVTITAPAALVATLTEAAPYSCLTSGATLEASATGGVPGYEYRLEDAAEMELVAFQSSPIFENITDGTYFLRVRDQNGCEAVSTASITVTAPAALVFDATPTQCYDGSNNGTIVVDVTSGGGGYQFRINGGAWVSPTPATATSHTFSGLAAGDYDIEVTDALGCTFASAPVTVTISDELTVNVEVEALTSNNCSDQQIVVTATGGVAPLEYAFVKDGLPVADSQFQSPNTHLIVIGDEGDYDVYVRDASDPATPCVVKVDFTVPPRVLASFSATPTDPDCHDGLGRFSGSVTGILPFTIELIDLDNPMMDNNQTINNHTAATYDFYNVPPGNYDLRLTDGSGCTRDAPGLSIVAPAELTATLNTLLSGDCDPATGFEFTGVTTGLTGTIEYSADGGTTWQTNPVFNATDGMGDPVFTSGNTVEPAIRTVDGGNQLCRTDFPRYTLLFPLDDLSINVIPVVVNCNELRVTVQGTQGTSPYEYTYTDDPSNFDFNAPPIPWTAPTAVNHIFLGLTPGRTYVFYVRDAAGCIRQSTINVNDLVTNPIEMATTATATCAGLLSGEIAFDLTASMASTHIRWELFQVGTPPTAIMNSGGNITFPASSQIVVSGLGEGEYYLEVVQSDGTTDSCIGASENIFIEELDAITATAASLRDIGCDIPGLIQVDGLFGGNGNYTFDVSGPAGFTALTGLTTNPIEIPGNSPSGDYFVTVTDDIGCNTGVLPAVTMTLLPNPTIDNITIDNCDATATVTITASGGTAPFAYSLDGGANYAFNGGVFDNQPPGTYTPMVLDASGCSASYTPTTIDVYPQLQATASLSQALGCGVGYEATITLEVLDGSGTYTYEIVGPDAAHSVAAGTALTLNMANQFDFDTDMAGSYSITITDDSTTPNCSVTIPITVAASVLPDFTASSTDTSCAGGDGTIRIVETTNVASPATYMLTRTSGPALDPTTEGIFDPATFTFGNVPGGVYSIQATGANGCTHSIGGIVVNEAPALSFDTAPVVTPFGCSSGNTADNATITVSLSPGDFSGGSGTYTRFVFAQSGTDLQDGTSTTYTHTDFAGGTFDVTVYDDKGCSVTTTVTIPPFNEIISTSLNVVTPITCNTNAETIEIGVTGTVTSNVMDYEFRQLPATTYGAAGDNDFPGLTPGTYTFGVRNRTTGCEIFVERTVQDPNTFALELVTTNPVCNGGDGTLSITMTDPVGSYANGFDWNVFDTNGTPNDPLDDTMVTSGNATNLGPTPAINIAAGSYRLVVTQTSSPECGQERLFTISEPSDPLSIAVWDELAGAGCDDGNASVLVEPAGGQGPYTITLTNTGTAAAETVSGVSSNLFENLSMGTYSISVTDALGCTQTFTDPSYEIALPDPISATLDAMQIDCFADTNGSITVNIGPRNASPVYFYTLLRYEDLTKGELITSSISQESNVFANLVAGFYAVSIVDSMGCTFETANVEIVQPQEVRALLTKAQDIGCTSLGALVLTAQEGTGPYRWSVDGTTYTAFNETDGPNTHRFDNVGVGEYSYYILDANDCASIQSNVVSMEEPEPLTLEVDDSSAWVNCSGENTAILIAEANGGLGDYQYALLAQDGTTELVPNQSNGLFANLGAGTYFVRVRSGSDCELVSIAYTIFEPDPLVMQANPTNISCFGEEDGSIEIIASGGTGNYQYAISPNLNQFEDRNIFEGLAAGQYIVVAQDSNGCFEVFDIEITEPEELIVSETHTDEICFESADGTITLTVEGGTMPFSTALNSSADEDFVEGALTFTNLPSGTHVVFVRDANGCEENVVVTIAPGVNLAGVAEVEYGCTDTGVSNNMVMVAFEEAEIAGSLLFGLDSDDPATMQLENLFEDVAPGDHTIYVLHEGGCQQQYDFNIQAFDPLSLSLQLSSTINTISVSAAGGAGSYTYSLNGGSQTTDTELIIRETATHMVTVTDANGCMVTQEIFVEFIDVEIPNYFTPDGDGINDIWKPDNIEIYPNIMIKVYDRFGRELFQFRSRDDGWNGDYADVKMPSGDYWYVMQLNDGDYNREFVGHFTLYR